MANPKQNTNTTAAAPTTDAFDLDKFLADNGLGHLKASDFREVGNFLPMYIPEWAFGEKAGAGETPQKFPPVVGKLIGLHYLPEQGKNDRAWTPENFIVEAMAPTKAVEGTKKDGNQKTVDVPVGGLLLVPCNKNIQQKKEFYAAAENPGTIATVLFRIRGKKDVGGPQDMWDYEAKIAGTEVRAGKYIIPSTAKNLQLTADGSSFNGATGEVVEKQGAAVQGRA